MPNPSIPAFESWRCAHDDKLFCPDEGCSKSFGCARDHGWKPGDPTPAGCSGVVASPAFNPFGKPIVHPD